MKRYRCTMQTRSGMYAQYDGYVDVWSDTDDRDVLFQAAVKALRRTSFPDYSRDMWKMVSAERIAT